MADVEVLLSIQGQKVKTVYVPSGTSIGELKIVRGLDSAMEFRLKGEPLSEDFQITEESVEEGTYLVGCINAKAAIA